MGKQSPASHWRRRRHGLDDDAKRLGSNLARTEKDHSGDRRECGQWHRNSRESQVSGPTDLPYVARQLRIVIPTAVSNGSREPLSHVWKIALAYMREYVGSILEWSGAREGWRPISRSAVIAWLVFYVLFLIYAVSMHGGYL